MKGFVQTVAGPVQPDMLGLTMMHEHLFCDLRRAVDLPDDVEERALAIAPVTLDNLAWVNMNAMRSVDNLVLEDLELAEKEALLFKKAGGGCLVDVTTPDFGRDPRKLLTLAERTGLHVVMGAGYYHEMFHPPGLADRSAGDVADEITRDIVEGVGKTGVRAGIIGEIGCSWPLRPSEAKILRASAEAQRRTGAAITIHPGRHPESPFQILEALEACGADLQRVVMGHMERSNLSEQRLLDLARLGCVMEYDWFGEVRPSFPYGRKDAYVQGVQFAVEVPSDGERLRTLADLVRHGYTDQIVISQDVCFKTRLAAYGGVGYAHIAKYVRQWMPEMGIGPEAATAILYSNPQRILTLG